MSPISPSGEAYKYNKRPLSEAHTKIKKDDAHLESNDPFVIDHEPRIYRMQILPYSTGIREFRDNFADEDIGFRDCFGFRVNGIEDFVGHG